MLDGKKVIDFRDFQSGVLDSKIMIILLGYVNIFVWRGGAAGKTTYYDTDSCGLHAQTYSH